MSKYKFMIKVRKDNYQIVDSKNMSKEDLYFTSILLSSGKMKELNYSPDEEAEYSEDKEYFIFKNNYPESVIQNIADNLDSFESSKNQKPRWNRFGTSFERYDNVKSLNLCTNFDVFYNKRQVLTRKYFSEKNKRTPNFNKEYTFKTRAGKEFKIDLMTVELRAV